MLPDGQTHLQKTEDKLEFTVEDIYPTSTRYQRLEIEISISLRALKTMSVG